MVKDNNIYYRESMEHKMEKVTTSGEVGTVYHGVPNWLYRGKFILIGIITSSSLFRKDTKISPLSLVFS